MDSFTLRPRFMRNVRWWPERKLPRLGRRKRSVVFLQDSSRSFAGACWRYGGQGEGGHAKQKVIMQAPSVVLREPLQMSPMHCASTRVDTLTLE